MKVMKLCAKENGSKILLKLWFLRLENSKDEDLRNENYLENGRVKII